MSPVTKWLLALIVALGVTDLALHHRLSEANAQATKMAYVADSATAVADTTRAVEQRVVNQLGDSLAAVTRRAVQTQQASDALDRSLKQRRIVTDGVTVHVDSLHTSTSAVTTQMGDSATQAVFDIEHDPYTVHANVVVPAPPDSARLTLSIALAPAHLQLRLGCSSTPTAGGINTASVSLVGPNWLHATLDTVTQDKSLCLQPRLPSTGGLLTRPRIVIPVTIAATLLVWEHWVRPWMTSRIAR